VHDLGPLVIGFLTLLLIPAIGVANLTRKRLTPLLSLVVGPGARWGPGRSSRRGWSCWASAGALPQAMGRRADPRLWLPARGAAEGARKTWRWIKLAMAAATIAAFAKGLWTYLNTYA
jgi:hypothetical protein